MIKRRTAAIASLAVIAALTACSTKTNENGAAANGPLTQVNFQLNFYPLADHAANYVALEKGYYRENGLDVRIIPGTGSGDSVRRVDSGGATFGIADTGVTIGAVGKGAKVKMIMMVLDKGTSAVYAKKSSGIKSVADLAGHTVGSPPEDAGRIVFPALASANGLDINKVKFVNIQGSAAVASLSRGAVDAVLSATTQAPFYESALGKDETVQLPYSDNGVDLYSNGIIASEKLIADDPELIRKFLKATLKGWEYTFAHPEEAIAIQKKHAPQIDVKQYEQNLLLVFAHMNTQYYQQNGVGWISEEKMAKNLEVLKKYSPEPPKLDDPKQVFTNDLLTRSELPKGLPNF